MVNGTGAQTLPSRWTAFVPITLSPHQSASQWPFVLVPLSWLHLWPLYAILAYQILRRVPSCLEWLSVYRDPTKPHGFVVPAVTKHARFLPVEAKHTFQYNTLYLAVRLDSLEAHLLDTGHAFSWKGQHYEPEYVPESQLAQSRLVHTPGATAEVGEKEVWKLNMRAAERVERRRKQEKRRKTGAYTWSLTHLAPASYLRTHFSAESKLAPGHEAWISGSILLKLAYELRERGYLTTGPQDAQLDGSGGCAWQTELGQVWTVTMPALAGITGINPLTVHYCFRPPAWGINEAKPQSSKLTSDTRGPFWLAILEVHNTFSERHIYVLEAGTDEDTEQKRRDYDHQWTFPRSFHVSPFNDRGGFYRLSLKTPFRENDGASFLLGVHLLLLVEPSDGVSGDQKLVKKLMATLDSPSKRDRRAVMPLSAGTLYAALLRQPTDLLTPFFRILWQAGKLHFQKRLDAFARPDMVQSREAVTSLKDGYTGVGLPPPSNPIQLHRNSADGKRGGESGGLVYPLPSSAELTAKSHLEQVASKRIQRLAKQGQHWTFSVESTNPADTGLKLSSLTASAPTHTLTLTTRSYGVYSDLMLYNQPRLALLLGSIVGRRWGVSSIEDFDLFFDTKSTPATQRGISWADNVRHRHQQWLIRQALLTHTASSASTLLQSFSIPCSSNTGALSVSGQGNRVDVHERRSVVTALWLGYIAARAEQKAFSLLGARYVKGTEPWLELSRGLDYLAHKSDTIASWDTKLGSAQTPH